MAVGAVAGPQKVPFVPKFLEKLGVKPGEWMSTSKLTIRVLLRPCWPLKVRIFALLLLQTHGYESDVAVIMRREEQSKVVVPLTPQGVASELFKAAIAAYKDSGIAIADEQRAQLKISKQDMRRALAEMEEDGILVRARINGPARSVIGKSLNQATLSQIATPLADLTADERKRLPWRQVCISLRAKPLPSRHLGGEGRQNCLPVENSAAADTKAVQLLLSFMRGLRKNPAKAAELAARPDVQAELAAFEQATERLKNFLASVAKEVEAPKPAAAAPPQPTLFDPQASTVSNPTPLGEGDSSDATQGRLPETRAAGEAVDHIRATTERGQAGEGEPLASDQSSGRAPATSTEAEPAGVVSRPRRRADLSELVNGLNEASSAHDRWMGPAIDTSDRNVQHLFGRCRDWAPDCTPAEVLARCLEKLALKNGRKLGNPFGYLLTAVPQCFEGTDLDAWRRNRVEIADEIARGGARKEPTASSYTDLLKRRVYNG
jgi:hypothetical protein